MLQNMTDGKKEIKPMKKISAFKTFLIVTGLIAFSAKLSILYIPTETINPKNSKPAPVTSIESDGLSFDAHIIKDPRRKQRGIRYSNRTVCFRI